MINSLHHIDDYVYFKEVYYDADSLKPGTWKKSLAIHTELSEKLLRYRNGDLSKKDQIVSKVEEFIKTLDVKFDVIIPVLPSKEDRPYQPLLEIAKSLSFNVDLDYLTRIPGPEIKHLKAEEKVETLKNIFNVENLKYKGKNVLIFDDVYDTGNTISAVADVLVNKGKVKNVYALTILKSNDRK